MTELQEQATALIAMMDLAGIEKEVEFLHLWDDDRRVAPDVYACGRASAGRLGDRPKKGCYAIVPYHNQSAGFAIVEVVGRWFVFVGGNRDAVSSKCKDYQLFALDNV